MKTHIILLYILGALIINVYGQKPKVTYLNQEFDKTYKSEAIYAAYLYETDSGFLKKTFRILPKDSLALVKEALFASKKEAKKQYYGAYIYQNEFTLEGIPISKISYRKGKSNPQKKYFYPNGQLQYMLQTNEGRVIQDERYYASGKLKARIQWGDVYPVKWEEFHENGQKRISVSYNPRYPFIPSGPIECYSPNGQLISTLTYPVDLMEEAHDSLLKHMEPEQKFFGPDGEEVFINEDKKSLPEAFGSQLVNIQEEDETIIEDPRPLNMTAVLQSVGYPKLVREASIDGSVLINALIDENGNVAFFFIENSPHYILDQVVLMRLSNLRFEPGKSKKGGVAFWVNIPFNFQILD